MYNKIRLRIRLKWKPEWATIKSKLDAYLGGRKDWERYSRLESISLGNWS